MSKNTNIHTKKEFLEMLGRVLDNTDVCLWTQNTSTFELKKKFNEKRVTFGFSADAFNHQDGIGDIMGSGIILLSICVCKKDLLSKGAINLLPKPVKKSTTKKK